MRVEEHGRISALAPIPPAYVGAAGADEHGLGMRNEGDGFHIGHGGASAHLKGIRVAHHHLMAAEREPFAIWRESQRGDGHAVVGKGHEAIPLSLGPKESPFKPAQIWLACRWPVSFEEPARGAQIVVRESALNSEHVRGIKVLAHDQFAVLGGFPLRCFVLRLLDGDPLRGFGLPQLPENSAHTTNKNNDTADEGCRERRLASGPPP